MLKALTQDLLRGPEPRQVPLPRALPWVGPTLRAFLFLATFRNGADLSHTQTGGPGLEGGISHVHP